MKMKADGISPAKAFDRKGLNASAGEFINRPLHAIARGEIDRSGQSQTNRLVAMGPTESFGRL
jgi:hypothetical protein